jgi:hypothetical protein
MVWDDRMKGIEQVMAATQVDEIFSKEGSAPGGCEQGNKDWKA